MRLTSSTIRLALDAATLVLVVIGIFFWFREPHVPTVRIPPVALNGAAAQSPRPSPAAADAGAIVTSNMFASSRAAPAVRYTPPGAGGSSADAATPAMQDEIAEPRAAPPRVYGTMTGPNGATALIQSDSSGASGRLYREGDRVGAFRIEKILASSVVVRGPGGRLELKVEDRRE